MNYFLDRRSENLEKIRDLGERDVLIGIPSFKNEKTIKYVVEVAAKGLKQFFPNMRAVIMNSDGDSPDGTRDAVKDADTGGIDKIISIYTGISGKGSAFRNIFEVAQFLGVKGCVVVDSDLRSITPEWINLLLSPVLEDKVDYVTPLYLRHKYDGTITNNFVYPLTKALYGYDIRQPIGGDFGFSSKLLKHYLGEDVWETDVAKYGIDIWMTTTAVVKGFRIGQAALGAKIHDAKDPSIFLAPMFRQVVGTCFEKAGQYYDLWKDVRTVKDTPLFGKPFDKEPEPVEANYDALIEKFKNGYEKYVDLWKKYVTAESFNLLEDVHKGLPYNFNISNKQWAHLIYDFMVAYQKFPKEKVEVLDSLTPLYFVKIADFINKTKDKGTKESEEMIIEQSNDFLREKDYLISMWEKEVLVRR